jgi:MFS family permease
MRNFAAGNLATAFVYGGLTLGSMAIALYLQEVAGYSAIAAGLITLPTPIASFLFARRVGELAARIGPRFFLIAGPAPAGVGLLLTAPTHTISTSPRTCCPGGWCWPPAWPSPSRR